MADLQLNEAHSPGPISGRAWLRTRMSYGDMFALGFYGGLGFMAATAVGWIALIVVLVITGVALSE